MSRFLPPLFPSRSPTPGLRRILVISGLAVAAGACGGGFTPPPVPSPSEIPELEAARVRAPDDPVPAVRLASAYREAGREAEARDLLQRTLEEHPGHGPAVYFLGLTYEDLGADSAALDLYARYAEEGDDEELREAVERRREVVRRRVLRTSVREAVAREASLAEIPARPRTVAVFPFTYVGPDPELRPLGRAMSAMLVTDLSQTDRLTVLDRLALQFMFEELALAETERVDPATALRGGRLLGAERVVQGQIDGSEAEVLIEAALVQGDAAETAADVSARDELAAFFRLQTELALGIYEALGIQLTPAERDRVTRRPTEDLAALLAFGLGLEAQDAGRFQEARQHFETARSLDPSFEMAGEALEQATTLIAGQALGPDALAQLGYGEVGELWARAEWLQRQIEFLPLETLVPGILDRDPVAEFLQQEGLAPSSATLEIVLPRPGGDR